MTTDIARRELVDDVLAVQDVRQQINSIQALMKDAMKDGEHFGVIPGTDKPSLYKAGAEKLSMMFRLAPRYDIHRTELPNGHCEFAITCTLEHVGSGHILGQGVGSCSTMESKYRYRNVADFEVTGEPIPADSKERKKEYRRQGFGMKKVDGVWEWVQYKDSAREENPDIADTYNTVLKMAKKRAHVDAVLTATAASDIFTQDMEDVAPPQVDEPLKTPASKPSPPEQDKRPISTAFASEKQVNFMQMQRRKKGITDSEWEALLVKITKQGKTGGVERKEVNDVLAEIDAWEQTSQVASDGEQEELPY